MIVADEELRRGLLRSKKFLDWLPGRTPDKKKVSLAKASPSCTGARRTRTSSWMRSTILARSWRKRGEFRLKRFENFSGRKKAC